MGRSEARAWSGARVPMEGIRAALATRAALLIILGAGFGLRLALAPVGNFQNDTAIMRGWAARLTSEPLARFYDTDSVVDHLPGDLWVLWLIARVHLLFAPGSDFAGAGFLFLVKLVPALADLGGGLMLYLIARRFGGQVRTGERIGLTAAAVYLFNPASIFLTSIWGQWDSLSAGIVLLALWLLLRGNPEWALPVLTYAVLIKPPFAALAPLFLLYFARRYVLPLLPIRPDAGWAWLVPAANGERAGETRERVIRRAAIAVGASVATLLAVTLPFDVGLPGFPTRWSLLERLDYALNYYPFTTLLAFNVWALKDVPSVTNFQLDTGPWLFGPTPRTWGNVFLLATYSSILVVLWRRWSDRAILWAGFAAMFATFMLPTRIHERYLFPAIALGALLVAVAPRARPLYAAISFTYFMELYWVYDLYYEAPAMPLAHGDGFVVLMTLITIGAFGVTLLGGALGWFGGAESDGVLSSGAGVERMKAWLTSAGRPGALVGAGDGGGGSAGASSREIAHPAPEERSVLTAAAAPNRDGGAAVGAGAAPATVGGERVRAAAAWVGARPDAVITAGLVLIALTLYLTRLDVPDRYIYDEVYHAYTAEEYVRGNADAYVWYTTVPEPKAPNVAYEWTHPPLGKLLIAGGIQVWGDSSFGWRLASAVFGAIGIGIAYWLGKRVGGSRVVGLLTAGALLVDGLYFVQSRTGMVDIFVLVFTLGALLSAYDYLSLPDAPGPIRWALVRTGLLLGLALATKWNAAYAAGLIGLVIVGHLALTVRRNGGVADSLGSMRAAPEPRRRNGGTGGGRSAKAAGRRDGGAASRRAGASADLERRAVAAATLRERLIWIPLGMGLAPALVYVLTFTPFFLEGHTISELRELHRQMWWYHTNLVATHDYASSWWQWPLAWKPVWYDVGFTPTTEARIYANLNPLLAWAMVPAVLWVSWTWWRERRLVALTILLVGFFGQWLPWALSPRIAFAYHFLPSVPFGALAVAVVVARLWGWRPATRYVAAGYVVAVVAAFIFFYPIYAGVPLTPERLEWRYWFDSWR